MKGSTDFQNLLKGNRLGKGAEEVNRKNLEEIIRIFSEADETRRAELFDQIFYSTRYDVMEALIDKKIANEAELYNIALKCKMDDLRSGIDTDSVQCMCAALPPLLGIL